MPYVTDEEVERMLAAARRDLPALGALGTFAFTGLRRAEALSLLWADVDLLRGLLRVLGKGGRLRYVPIIRPLKEILEALRAQSFAADGDVVLVGRYGRPLGRNGLMRVVRQYANEAGIAKHVTPHAFRHGVATRLAARGVDVFTIAAILGHREITTTQRYVHPSLGSKRDALAVGATAATSEEPLAPAAGFEGLDALLRAQETDWSVMAKSLRVRLTARSGERQSSEKRCSQNFAESVAPFHADEDLAETITSLLLWLTARIAA